MDITQTPKDKWLQLEPSVSAILPEQTSLSLKVVIFTDLGQRQKSA